MASFIFERICPGFFKESHGSIEVNVDTCITIYELLKRFAYRYFAMVEALGFAI
jgi:hypothetical protein